MPYGTLLTDTIKSSTSGPVAFQNTSGTEVGTLCRAWVNFNGTGTVAIRGSFNVSSITDNGTGNYTVNLTNAMTDTNYAAVGNSGPNTSSNSADTVCSASTTSAVEVRHFESNAAADVAILNVAVFR